MISLLGLQCVVVGGGCDEEAREPGWVFGTLESHVTEKS